MAGRCSPRLSRGWCSAVHAPTLGSQTKYVRSLRSEATHTGETQTYVRADDTSISSVLYLYAVALELHDSAHKHSVQLTCGTHDSSIIGQGFDAILYAGTASMPILKEDQHI